MLHWAYNCDHFCTNCKKQLTHKHHDSPTQVTEEAKQRIAQLSAGPPREQQPEISQAQPIGMPADMPAK